MSILLGGGEAFKAQGKTYLMGFQVSQPAVPDSDPHSYPGSPGTGVLTLHVPRTPWQSEKAHGLLLTMMFLNAESRLY